MRYVFATQYWEKIRNKKKSVLWIMKDNCVIFFKSLLYEINFILHKEQVHHPIFNKRNFWDPSRGHYYILSTCLDCHVLLNVHIYEHSLHGGENVI